MEEARSGESSGGMTHGGATQGGKTSIYAGDHHLHRVGLHVTDVVLHLHHKSEAIGSSVSLLVPSVKS